MLIVKRDREANRTSVSGGFTLIEILASIAIIGVLVAIAIPQFNKFREKAYFAQVKADLHSLSTTQEAYYIESDTYIAITQETSGESNIPLFRWTKGVVLLSSSGDLNSWSATLTHINCPCQITYSSALGGYGNLGVGGGSGNGGKPDKKNKPDKKAKPDKKGKSGKV